MVNTQTDYFAPVEGTTNCLQITLHGKRKTNKLAFWCYNTFTVYCIPNNSKHWKQVP